MKFLTIGLDGGDQKIIKAMPMPNLHKILNQNVCIDIEEDLWSRGWVKILCGLLGHETGAFYAKPKLDGTHNTTQNFSISDYLNLADTDPLWKRLSEKGHKVGFMNVPSMMPAPEVKGFAVSGGGAGASTSGASSITEDACYPVELKYLLEKDGYILDTRFVSSGLRTLDTFFERLTQMTQIRTKAFTNLQKRIRANFGFVAYMSVCRIQYLAMSEIEALIQNDCKPLNYFQEKLLQFYSLVDEQIGKLVENLTPQSIMLVSDHGQSPRRYSVNVNDWLARNGFQVKLPKTASGFRKTVKSIAGILPQDLKKYLGRTAPGLKEATFNSINADWSKTRAFGLRYVPGIYINDQVRFGGPVRPEREYMTVVNELIDHFNKSESARENELSARTYRPLYSESKYESLLPDIWIDHPDKYFFEQSGAFIQSNEDYGPINNLNRIEQDMFTGIKGRYPLLCVSHDLARLVKADDKRDLTLAYKLIVRGMDA